MKEIQRNKRTYITDEERKKCRKVMIAFEELYIKEDIVVATFTDSKELFAELWVEWRNSRLVELSKETPIANLKYKDIFQCLSPKDRKEIIKKRHYFAKKAGIKEKR